MNNLLPRALRLPIGSRGILQPLQWRPTPSPILQSSPITTKPPGSKPRTPHRQPIDKSHLSFSRAPVPPPSKTEQDLIKLGYLVRRTSSQGLPIYRRFKNGNRQIILVKRIDGDRMKLLDDLVGGIGIEREHVRLNAVTQQIEIKGDYLDKTKEWLLQQGF